MGDVIDSHIESLRNEVQPVCRTWLHIVTDDLKIDARIIETLRTRRRQEALQARGVSQVKLGWHQVGAAWDFGCFRNGVYVTDGGDSLYEKCGLVGEALWCTWGGRWGHLKDSGHLEYHPGATLQQWLNHGGAVV